MSGVDRIRGVLTLSAYALRVELCLARAVEDAVRFGRSPWVTTSRVSFFAYEGAPHVRTWAGRNAAVSNALHDLARAGRARASLGPNGETWSTDA